MSKEAMSNEIRELFDQSKQAAQIGAVEAVKEGVVAIAPGLENLFSDMKAELSRLGTQGTMELASALFNGSAFVPYGPGVYTPSQEQDAGVHGREVSDGKEEAQQEQQRERGGRGM